MSSSTPTGSRGFFGGRLRRNSSSSSSNYSENIITSLLFPSDTQIIIEEYPELALSTSTNTINKSTRNLANVI